MDPEKYSDFLRLIAEREGNSTLENAANYLDDLAESIRQLGRQRCETCINWTAPLDQEENLHKTLESAQFSCQKNLPIEKYCPEYYDCSEVTIHIIELELEEAEEKIKKLSEELYERRIVR